MVTTESNVREPFELGFEGEQWHTPLHALKIPIPGQRRAILVARHAGGFTIIANGLLPKQSVQAEDMLIAASIVCEVFEKAKNDRPTEW